MVTLEDNRFEDSPGGRKSRSIRDWSVEKIKRAGGDGVKLLTWFRPDADADVLAEGLCDHRSIRRRAAREVLKKAGRPFLDDSP